MSSVDRRVTGLNSEVYQALKDIQSRHPGPLSLQATDALKAVIDKGGIDPNERHLLDQLLAGNPEIQVYAKDPKFGPDGLKLQGLNEAAKHHLLELKYLDESPHSEQASEIDSVSDLGEEHDQEKFVLRAEGMLQAKFGIKSGHSGAIAKNLFVAMHQKDPVKRGKAIAEIIVRLNETPEGKKAIQQIAEPLLAKLPADSAMRTIVTKLFADKGSSDGRIACLATVINGEFEGIKDLRASYELLQDFGPDIKALLPDNLKDHVERLESLFGQKLGKHVKDVLKNVLPLGESSDLVRASLKMLTGDGVAKVSAGVDFLNAVGQRMVGADNQTLAAITDFLKVDGRTSHALRHLLDADAPVALRAEALKTLAETFHGRLEKILEQFGVKDGEAVLKQAQAHPLASRSTAAADKPADLARLDAEAPRLKADLATGPGLRNLAAGEAAALEKVVVREAKLTATAEKMGLEGEVKAALAKIFGDPKLDEAAVEQGLKMFEKMGAEPSQSALKVLQQMDPKIARRIFSNPKLGQKVLDGIAKMVPAMEKLGLSTLDLAPKLATGISKVIPAVGGLASGYDAVRMGTIAATGKDPAGKKYKDPDVRALALLGASANSLDTALAILEATGIGNADFMLQLGLAGVEVALDLMIEYYNQQPEKMPPELRLGIKAAALGVALVAPLALPPAGLAATAAVVTIYGLDGTLDIGTELTKVMGNAALDGMNKLHDLQTRALDRGLAVMANDINGLAEVVRNPEKYAAQLGLSSQQVLSQAADMLKQKASENVAAAKQVYSVLTDIANHPGAYAQKSVDFAFQTGLSIGKEVDFAASAAASFVKEMSLKGEIAFADGAKALYQLGVDGAKAAKDLFKNALNKGGKMATAAIDFAKSVATHPGQYGKMAGKIAAEAAAALHTYVLAGKAKAEAALIALNVMAVRGIDNAVKGLSDVVATGGAMAVKALGFLKDAPPQVAKAMGQGLLAAYRSGKAGLEVAQWVSQNPQQALQKMGDVGRKVLESTRDYLIKTAQQAKKDATDAVKYLEDLYSRSGAALGRFGDTLVEIMKKGSDVGQEMVGRHWSVIKTRGPELISALGNLGQAGLDLMVKLARWQPEASKWAVDGLVHVASKAGAPLKNAALQKLNQMGATDAIVKLANQGKVSLEDMKRMGSQAIQAILKKGNPAALSILLMSGRVKVSDMLSSLISQGADGIRKLMETSQRYKGLATALLTKITAEMSSAWGKSSISNGYAPLRALINKYLSQSAQAGAEASLWMKRQLGEALAKLDHDLEAAQKGKWLVVSIPDVLVEMVK